MPLLVGFCFLLSGACGLVYEVAWSRMLGLVVGNTTLAIATVVAAYMAGLAWGNAWSGRWAARSHCPGRAYGLLELGIALSALAVPQGIHLLSPVFAWAYRSLGGGLVLFTAVRLGLCGLLLVLPTFLMGATLPFLTEALRRRGTGLGAGLGMLYGINSLGAVAGALGAGFVLLPRYGNTATTWLAAGGNLLAGSLMLAFLKPAPNAATSSIEEAARSGWRGAGLALLVAFLSGLLSMMDQAAWTRVLALVLGSSVYAFSLIVSAFILGIALGSLLSPKICPETGDLHRALAWVQAACGLGAAFSIVLLGSLPYRMVALVAEQGGRFGSLERMEFLHVLVPLLLPTTALGASLPLACRLAAQGRPDPSRWVGRVFAVNTAGAILGTVLASFVWIPAWGTLWTILATVLAHLGLAAWLFHRGRRGTERTAALGLLTVVLTVVLTPLGGLLLRSVWDTSALGAGVFVYGKGHARKLGEMKADPANRGLGDRQLLDRIFRQSDQIWFHEGLGTTVSVTEAPSGDRSLSVNGKVDASSGWDMKNQLLVGHLPLLLHPRPKRVLVIGVGSGVTLGAVTRHPVEKAAVVEIAPSVVEAARRWFGPWNDRVLEDPAAPVEVILQDARSLLVSTRERYDVIISEPSNPWIAGISTLFTQEFYRACQDRLNPGGVFCQWLQSYSMSEDDFRLVLRTFGQAFPHVSLWQVRFGGDNLILGTQGPLAIDAGALADRMRRPELRRDIARAGIMDAAHLLAHFVAADEAFRRYAGPGILNTDDRLALEFSAPRALHAEDHVKLIRVLCGMVQPLEPFLRGEGAGEIAARLPDLRRARDITGRGMMALSGPGFAEAPRCFQEALAIDPLQDEARDHLFVFCDKRRDAAAKAGDNPDYERLVRVMLGIRPDSLQLIRTAADRLKARGHIEEAQTLYGQYLIRHPEDPVALLDDALVIWHAGDAEQALAQARKALRIPADYDFRRLLSLDDADSRTDPVAERPLAAELRRHHLARAQGLIGQLLHARQRYGEALEPLRKALALEPTTAETRDALVDCLLQTGQADQAVDVVEELLRREPGNVQGRHLKGVCQLARKDYAGAEATWTELLRQYPDREPTKGCLEKLRVSRKEGAAP